MNTLSEVIKIIKKRRKKLGLDQKDMQRLIGMSQQ
ncbi:MAG TPA: helix-turn-helix domain-containing protein [Psychromonas hadalis]|nr:helix-turn-helix domain-containing protein [Psychromonas hadalis]